MNIALSEPPEPEEPTPDASAADIERRRRIVMGEEEPDDPHGA